MNYQPDRVKGNCPNCGPGRWALVVGHHTRKDDDNSGIWYRVDHRLLKCPACDEIYHQTVEVYSEDIFQIDENEWDFNEKVRHWPEVPKLKRFKPDWIAKLGIKDTRLEELMDDVYRALNSNLSVFAVIGIRTVFDRAAELLGLDPAKTFAEKLIDLHEQGFIGETEKELLEIATDAGSAAAHRGWKPSDEELLFALNAVEAFLNRVFIQRDNAKVLKNAIPQKPARRKKALATK